MKSNCKRHFFGNVVVKKIVDIMTYELSKLKRSKMIRYLDEMTVEYNKKSLLLYCSTFLAFIFVATI